MKFGYDIRDIKVVDNQVIVLLSIPFHTNEIDNIYAVSLDCKINWRVESLNIISPDGDNLPYENLFFHNGELTATDFYGRRYFINHYKWKDRKDGYRKVKHGGIYVRRTVIFMRK